MIRSRFSFFSARMCVVILERKSAAVMLTQPPVQLRPADATCYVPAGSGADERTQGHCRRGGTRAQPGRAGDVCGPQVIRKAWCPTFARFWLTWGSFFGSCVRVHFLKTKQPHISSACGSANVGHQPKHISLRRSHRNPTLRRKSGARLGHPKSF